MRHLMLTCAVVALCAPAQARETSSDWATNNFAREQTGTAGGVSWKARSMMVGQTSTLATTLDPIYKPTRPAKDGLGFLEVSFGGLGTGYCSGSLMADGRSIITAAHCVSFGGGVPAAEGGSVYFYKGAGDPFYDLGYDPLDPDFAKIEFAEIYVAPGYTGDVIDQNDVAIIRLAEVAPDWATRYTLSALSDPTGVEFTVNGFGNNGESGDTGAFGGTFGRHREGENRYDFRLGDDDFADGWSVILGEPSAQIEHSWVSDFDRLGSGANDTACAVAADPFFGLAGPKFCDTGVGAREVGVAGGDSGGPQFVDGKIVSVTSYGLTFGAFYGDSDDFLNSSFGEFSGYAPLWIHEDWIEGYVANAFGVIPEPATWGMMLVGFGAVGFAVRRKDRLTRVSA